MDVVELDLELGTHCPGVVGSELFRSVGSAFPGDKCF
jgi:hypothetical protein